MIDSIGASGATSLNAIKQSAEVAQQTANILEAAVETQKAATESESATPAHRGQNVNTSA